MLINEEEKNVEETAQNEVAPEAANEEVKVAEEPAQEASNRINITKPEANQESYAVEIEKARKELFEAYNKSRKISNIITVVVLVAAIGSMLMITSNNPVLTILGWALVIAALIGLVVYYLANKNKFPNRTREYIKFLTTKLNQNMFQDEKFEDVNTDPNEKMNLEDVIGDSVYEQIGTVASRNVVRGKFAGKDFLYGEMALGKVGATKKDGPIFVGKYVSIPNNLELRGRIIINFRKAETPVDIPTSIGNLDLLEESNGMFIYGYKDTDVKAVLGTLFLSKIKDLVPENHLMNTNVVIWAGKTGFYFSYDDVMMALPFDKPFDKECNEQGVSNVQTAFIANEMLGK